MNRKIILVILLIIVAGVIGYFSFVKNSTPYASKAVCEQETGKQCYLFRGLCQVGDTQNQKEAEENEKYLKDCLPKIGTWQPIETGPPMTSDISSWKTYRDDSYGFEIRYPSDWVFEETPQYTVLQNGQQKPLGWYIQYHDKQGYNTFSVEHRLVETPQGDIWNKDKYIKNISGKLQSEENVIIDGVTGTKIIYQISHQIIEEIIIQKPNDQKLWLLSLMSVDKLQYQQSSLQTILSSFKFINKDTSR